jgi:hypothetical protein
MAMSGVKLAEECMTIYSDIQKLKVLPEYENISIVS